MKRKTFIVPSSSSRCCLPGAAAVQAKGTPAHRFSDTQHYGKFVALGVGDKVVGVTSWCTYPPEADMAYNHRRCVQFEHGSALEFGARFGH